MQLTTLNRRPSRAFKVISESLRVLLPFDLENRQFHIQDTSTRTIGTPWYFHRCLLTYPPPNSTFPHPWWSHWVLEAVALKKKKFWSCFFSHYPSPLQEFNEQIYWDVNIVRYPTCLRTESTRTRSQLAPGTQFGNEHQHHAPTRRQPNNQWPLQPNHCPGLSMDRIIIFIYLCHIFMTRSALVS